ncbi:MAG: restriction endonuclease subunit S [Prevotella sp.]|nr:restriction endonuclease subunit S [Prevotella sp.]
MIETRFKDTEVGRIPEDWEVNTIGEISDVKTGPFGSALHSDDYVLNGVPIITVEHIGHIDINISNGVPKVGKSDYHRLNSYVLKKNDLVFSRVGSVDRCSYVSENEDGWLFSGRLLRVRLKRNIDSLYLTYHLQTDEAKKRVVSVAVGLAMPSINTKILSGVSVVIPKDKSEQTRIATALSNIDALISELGKLIEKKRAIKQGAMQQLLTGKKRLKGFSEPWVEKKLGEILQYEQPTKYLVSSTDYSDNGVPVLTAGKTFILGYTNDPNGIYNNLPVIIFDDFVTESKYVDFPFKAKSSAMKMLTLRNEENNLRFVFEIMQMIDFPMTDHKRWWIGEYSNIIVKAPLLDEQNAIASVLTSMDNEISALEAKKAKYEQIKQGMMQQLLTGKIRLVETAVKTKATSANVHFRRSVLAAEIADRLCEEPTFGHVKMEKMLFLTERLCHIDIGSHYHRDAAGPYDNRALRSIDSQLRKQKWFDVKRTEKGNRYVPMQNCGKHKTYFDKYYSTVLPTFEKIIDTFKTQNTERCEIVATLYSAWEDLLHSNKPFTDADIVNEVLNNWHESKKRISKERWLSAIQWMRENGFAPDYKNN